MRTTAIAVICALVILVACSGKADFRLVKTANSASVYAVKDGKKSPIASWAWVERNAPGQRIDTISQAELDGYGDSGVTFK